MADIAPEEFRRMGHEMVDWMADYLEGIRDYPVVSKVQPGELTDQLPASAPELPECLDEIFDDFRNTILPAVTHWNHPRFHAYFSVSASAPGILAEMLSATLNVNGMVWKSCPAATELEQVTLSWLRRWMGLPDEFFGIIHDTASTSTMHALAAAREMADPEARTRGALPNLTVYTSEHAHSSVEKGAIALGFGQNNVRRIPVDADFRMKPEALAAAMEADLKAGKKPCCVTPTVGTTSISSIDPVRAIAKIAADHGAWVHVDGSYAGVAAIVPEFRWLLDGCDGADSIVVNPHKWLFTPIDLSAFYTRRPEILRRAFSLVAEFLKTSEDGHALNYMDYGVPLGRRFRALKLWFVMRAFGRERVAEIMRSHIAWAHELAAEIRLDPEFELAAPVPLSLVCFRFRGTNEQNRKLLELVNASGIAFLSHTVLNGQFVLRLAIGSVHTEREDVQKTWGCVRACSREL
jgi:aromatic-L-amino-acid/L-tryptophan decarboxylase